MVLFYFTYILVNEQLNKLQTTIQGVDQFVTWPIKYRISYQMKEIVERIALSKLILCVIIMNCIKMGISIRHKTNLM